MTSEPLDFPDPVNRCAAAVETALDEATGVNPLFLSADAKRQALVALTRLESRLSALKFSVLAVSQDVAEEDGNRHTATWLAAATKQDPAPVHAGERFAKALDSRWSLVAEGLASGEVNIAQAEVVVRVLDRLLEPLPADPDDPDAGPEPRRIGPAVIAKAEAVLVGECARLTPRELKAAADRILEMVAPEIAEDEERRRLEREEKRAAAATRLSLRRRGDGTTDLSARIPDAAASRLKTYLQAFTSPRHDAGTRGGLDSRYIDPTTGRRLPQDRVLGEAFCSFLEAADPARMPLHGGDATRVIVTIDWESLKTQTGVATLGDGTRISVGQVRRMACSSGILPAVLGGRSEVLDLGRSKRLFTSAQRTALGIDQPHCRAEHCTVPAAWCEAHHRIPWSTGGKTDLKDGTLLCPWHHQRVHDTAYRHEFMANGDVRFTRRR